ncbi:MAG: helix-turn-helix domain-containing protein [Deltaproteobacteria bacterium]|nr:helix-turn-helix domain-containing protein [Deltaproteobacteria bacterium]
MSTNRPQVCTESGEAFLDEGLVSIRSAASFLCRSRSSVYQLMDDGQLPFVKIGRSRRIPKRALVNLIAENTHGGSRASDPCSPEIGNFTNTEKVNRNGR